MLLGNGGFAFVFSLCDENNQRERERERKRKRERERERRERGEGRGKGGGGRGKEGGEGELMFANHCSISAKMQAVAYANQSCSGCVCVLIVALIEVNIAIT